MAAADAAGLVLLSEDEQSSSDQAPPEPRHSSATIQELEQEVKELEQALKREKEERRRQQTAANQEIEREVQIAEERWMERARVAMQERDVLATRTQQMEEQLEVIRIDVNRAVAYRLEMEESRNRIKSQLDAVQRDYEETMHERSTVLEENQRLSEDRDTLRQAVRELKQTLDQMTADGMSNNIHELNQRLEQTRRLLQFNMEETALSNAKNAEANEQNYRLRQQLEHLTVERDEAIRRANDAEMQREPIVDLWSTHQVDVALPLPKPQLGIILAGGRTDERHVIHAPIYVKDVLIGSPLENTLKRLDHILIVNDIDVTDMDQRSVIDILKNSHHLKMVIRRRSNQHKIHEVTLQANQDIGVELGNGVFVNGVDSPSAAARAGITSGSRVVHVNHVPVYDAKHAEQLIKYSNGQVIIGLLDGKKRSELHKDVTKQRTLFSKIFGRQDKQRNVVAKASISPADGHAFYRQGSLRMPAPQQHELVRYGSLRAPPGSAESARIAEKLEFLNKNNSSRNGAEGNGSTWPKVVPEEEAVVSRRRSVRPSVFPVFPPNSPQTRFRQSVEIPSSRMESISSPWGTRRETPRQITQTQSVESSRIASPYSHRHDHRVSCYSPALPQPPPYPGPREDSLSSILSSTNSLPLPGSSIGHHYTNNSPSGTLLSETSDKVRRVHLSREGNDFGLGLENSNGGVVITTVQGKTNGVVRRGDRLLDVGGINMRSADKEAASRVISHFGASQDEVTLLVAGQTSSRWVQVLRKNVRLCGGNAIGILAESSAGDLQEGDLILEIDGYNVRGATLEEATEALLESLSEMAELLIEDGGDRLNRLRLGADGDRMYIRINVDRSNDNRDELDIKAGEIVFVDKTLFMGQRGRWRAWKMDREGRQRENGIIPSASQMESLELRKKKNRSMPLSRPVYERMEKVSASRRRPVVLFGPLLAPFTQTLLDDSTKFSQVVPECRALAPSDVERLLHSCELIEVRKREKLFDVISVAAINNITDQGVHCIIDISPSAIQRLYQLRIHPIIIRIKFKASKQIRDIKEDFFGEKLSSKAAKELMDKASAADQELESLGVSVVTIAVHSQGPTRSIVKHVCHQIVTHVEHEQKKTIWVPQV